MEFNRRHFCSALAIGSTGMFSKTVSAQSAVQITGSISSAVGADIEGVKLTFQHIATNSVWTYTVPASGDIDLTVSETGQFRVRLFDTTARNDTVPLVYSFGRTTVDDTGSSVSYTIPQSYAVTIQCVDENGSPTANLPVVLRAGGTAHQPGLLTTTEQGYVTFDEPNEPANQPELQLAGPTSVEVSKNGIRQPLGEINVTENAKYEFEVTNPEKFTPNYTLIESDSDKGFNYPYFLYTPRSLKTSEESPRPIFVAPNNSFYTDNDLTTHIEEARESAAKDRPRKIAERVGIPLVVPVFPRQRDEPEPWWVNPQALGPHTFTLEESPLSRVDLQLLEMVEDAKSRLEADGHTIAPEIHIDGFSTSGDFACRFTILHPERVNAASHGGTWVKALPKTTLDDDVPVVGDPEWSEMDYPVGTENKELPYPIGVANLEELTGSAFNREAWLETPQYIYIGGADDPEPVKGNSDYPSFDYLYDEQTLQNRPSERSYGMPDLIDDIYGRESIDERWKVSRAVYENVGAAATFTVYEGYGHTPRPAIDDLVEFHNNEIQNTYGSTAVSESTSSGEGKDSREGDNAAEDSGGNETVSISRGEESPGFGFGAALSGIAGAGYMLKRRIEYEI